MIHTTWLIIVIPLTFHSMCCIEYIHYIHYVHGSHHANTFTLFGLFLLSEHVLCTHYIHHSRPLSHGPHVRHRPNKHYDIIIMILAMSMILMMFLVFVVFMLFMIFGTFSIRTMRCLCITNVIPIIFSLMSMLFELCVLLFLYMLLVVYNICVARLVLMYSINKCTHFACNIHIIQYTVVLILLIKSMLLNICVRLSPSVYYTCHVYYTHPFIAVCMIFVAGISSAIVMVCSRVMLPMCVLSYP